MQAEAAGSHSLGSNGLLTSSPRLVGGAGGRAYVITCQPGTNPAWHEMTSPLSVVKQAQTYGDFVAGRPLTWVITKPHCPTQAWEKGRSAEKLNHDFMIQEEDARWAVELGAETTLSVGRASDHYPIRVIGRVRRSIV